VVGACVGYYLARAGADVVLVDAAHPGRLTTSASFAWVNASSKSNRGVYFDLNFAGLREYERLLSQLSGATWWNPTGHIRWDHRNEPQLTNRVERLRARGYPAEVWKAARVQRLLEPNVVFDSPSALVAFFPSEGWVDGRSMVHALVDAAVTYGATTVFGSAVRAITVTDGAVTSINLASGEKYAVETVVNAAGPAAASVAALVSRVLRMNDNPGLAVRVETREGVLRRVIHAPNVAMRPDGARRVFLISRRVDRSLGKAGQASAQLVERVKRLAARVVPELADASVVDARVGYRPIPADGLPAIGAATRITGYYEAVTHSGITLGPIIARTLTAEILHGRIDPLVAHFRASRLGRI
jgi:glycine/D-amino acid oxidase-like deaminating enzyme